MLDTLTALLTTAGPLNTTLKASTGAGIQDVVNNMLGNLGTEGIHALLSHPTPEQRTRINHDLQRAFREAIQEALYDLRGADCFPSAWRPSMRTRLHKWAAGGFALLVACTHIMPVYSNKGFGMAETRLVEAVRTMAKPAECESMSLPKRQEYAYSHTWPITSERRTTYA